MAQDTAAVPAWQATVDERSRRWEDVLAHLVGLLPPDVTTVVVDGGGAAPAMVADRLAAAVHATGRPCARLTDANPYGDEDTWLADRTAATVALADGSRWRQHRRWDLVIWIRTAGYHGSGETGADVVIDLHDLAWPVIRQVAAGLADRGRWYVGETRAFFAPRAATWDTKFGDDLPAYAAAITDAGITTVNGSDHAGAANRSGGLVLDVGCGTGRALPALRQALGAAGRVIGIDLTPEMLTHARARVHRPRPLDSLADLLVADARRLPIRDAVVDAVFAAGLIMHLPDAAAGLRELARVTRPGGLLVLFHPSGRAALAARHGRTLRADEALAEGPLDRTTTAAGWRITRYDDDAHRFLAIAQRQSPQPARPQ